MAKSQKIFSISGHPSQNEEDYCLIPCINKIFDGAIIWFIFWKMRQNWKLWFEKEMQLLSNFTKSLYPLCYIVTHCKKKVSIVVVNAHCHYHCVSKSCISFFHVLTQNLRQKSKTAKGNWISQNFSNSHIKRGLYQEKNPARAQSSAEFWQKIMWYWQRLRNRKDMLTKNPLIISVS